MTRDLTPPIPSRKAAAENSPGRKPWEAEALRTHPKPRQGRKSVLATVLSPLAGLLRRVSAQIPRACALGYCLAPLRGSHPVTPSPRHPLTPSPPHPVILPRRGLTLVELLIVVSLLLLITLVAIPAIQPGLDSQRIREAARTVNIFLGNARNRAEESGRPYGVEIERAGAVGPLQTTSVRLHQIEVPPPYGGDTMSAVVRVVDVTPSGSRVTLQLRIQPATWSSGLVQPGDTVQLNYQGPLYTLSTPASGDFPLDANGQFFDFSDTSSCSDCLGFSTRTLTVVGDPTQRSPTQWVVANPNPVAAFTVRRQPVRTMVAPVALPQGTAIDLFYSGTTTAPPAGRGAPAHPSDPVQILFSPSGSVDRVYWQPTTGVPRATEPIYLLVGRRDRAQGGILPEDGLDNLADLNNFWIAIQPQTGLTITANVAAGAPDVAAARSLVNPSQAVGGR